ncbi:hypothetical protein L1049_015804 [Liquidambar formosana]|uniref:Uncharacterized protein n=1 Tax=Liquidambar formosana TaxID=63359 RepID=A0AAP0S469_LIQFO
MLNKTKRKMLNRTKDTELIINEIHKLNDQVRKLAETLERKAKFEGFKMTCSMVGTAATIASSAVSITNVSITNDHYVGLIDKLKDNPLLSFFKGLLKRVPVGKVRCHSYLLLL